MMDALLKLNPVERALADEFAKASRDLPGGSAVADLRSKAFAAFEEDVSGRALKRGRTCKRENDEQLGSQIRNACQPDARFGNS